MKNSLLLFFTLIILACKKDQTEPPNEFLVNKNKWEALNINSYSFTLQISCFCTEETLLPKNVKVVNNKITLVNETPFDHQDHWGVMTITQFFDEICTKIIDNVAQHSPKDGENRVSQEQDRC